MKYLFKGMMKNEEFDQLISMSKFRSDGIISSLRNYLVKGQPEDMAIIGNEVKQPNFNRDLNKIESLYSGIVKYNEIIQVTRINKVI